MLTITTEIEPKSGINLIHLKGVLGNRTAQDFEKFIHDFIQQGKHYAILDASELEVLSGNGISVFTKLTTSVQEKGGKFILVATNLEVEMLLDFLEISSQIHCLPNIEAALEFFATHIPLQTTQEVTPPKSAINPKETTPQTFSDTSSDNCYLEADAELIPDESTSATKIMCNYCGIELYVPEADGSYMCPGCGQKLSPTN